MAITNQLVTFLIGSDRRTSFGTTDKNFVGPSPPLEQVIEFDATLSESHALEASVTDHPIELGAYVSDHYRLLPQKITIDGIITNIPLPNLHHPLASLKAVGQSVASGIYRDESTTRTAIGYELVRSHMKNASLLTVITSLKRYEDMVITSFSVDKDAKTSNVLKATIGLRELKRVVVKRQKVSSLPARSKNEGAKAPVDAKPKETSQTSSDYLLSKPTKAFFESTVKSIEAGP